MWPFKVNKEDDICMAAAGFLFLASKIAKEKNKRRFWVRPTLCKRTILTNTSLPYSTFEVLNSCPLHSVKGPQYAKTSLQVAKLTTYRNLLINRPATGLGRVEENTNKLQEASLMLQNCCKFVAKYLLSISFLFCQFSVDPA